MADWFFIATFSRAELYGFGIFILALSRGASPLLCLVAFFAWAIFANIEMKKRERENA